MVLRVPRNFTLHNNQVMHLFPALVTSHAGHIRMVFSHNIAKLEDVQRKES